MLGRTSPGAIVVRMEGTIDLPPEELKTDLKDLEGKPFREFLLVDYGFERMDVLLQCVDRNR